MPKQPRKESSLPASVRDVSQRIAARARRAKVDLLPASSDALGAYFSLLLRWNAKINLTGIATVEEAVDRILLEPISAAGAIDSGQVSLIDIGSGGGSPAIPLRIVRPNLKLWMVESKGRKAAFLRECVRELGLTDVFVENARAEELLTQPALTESMDYASVRAVRLDARFLNTMQAFVKPGGSLLLFGTRDTNVDVHSVELAVVGSRNLLGRSGSQLAVLRKKSVPSLPLMHGVAFPPKDHDRRRQ